MRGWVLYFVFLAVSFDCSEAITVMSIDLGTEWMKIAIVKPGVPMEIVLNKETKRKTEVSVSFKDGERLFGSSAFSQGVRFPKNTYSYLLDLLAKKIDNPVVEMYKKRFPYYNLIADPETGYVRFKHDDDTVYAPEELLAMTLNYSRSLAEDYAQQPVDTCIITVPSFFNQAERLMLLYATKLAGLKGAQLMDDNVASALNYGVFRRQDINVTATYIMFYDMGASSTTATIVAYQVVKANGIADPQLSVKGVGYDRSLGGLEMEMRLRELLIKRFDEKKKTKSDVRKNPRSMAKLLKEAGRVKKVLSANIEHQAQIEGLIDDEDFKTKVTREEFEELCADLWPRVATPMNIALESASLTMDLISKIILVGGGTRVPKVQEILIKESGKSDLGRSLNTDEAPALGASYEAAARSNAFRVKTFHLKMGTVYPIDIEFDRKTKNEDGSDHVKHVRKTLFQRNNPYPQRKVITFNRFYSDFGFDVNYGDLSFLKEDQLAVFGKRNISSVMLKGVDVAHEKYGNKNDTESKGVKAHFRMDENGILNLEEVEALYESNVTIQDSTNETEDDPTTFQKLKDSFSNLFGGGEEEKSEEKEAAGSKEEDKQEKPEEVGEKEKKEEEAKDKEEKTKDKEENTKEKEQEKPEKPEEDKSVNNTDEAKGNKTTVPVKAQKKKHSVPLDKSISRHDLNENSETVFNASRDRLKMLAEKDALKIAREEAMNNLEAYIYDKQDKLYQEDYEKALTEKEQEDIPKALTEASDWMFELEEEQMPEVYKEKLSELRRLARPWLLRVKERGEYSHLLKDMESMFNYTVHFIAAVDALSEDDQIYTEAEIKLLKRTFNETVTWKNDTLKQQEALAPSADNILKPDDIKQKIGMLNREVQYLLNKARTAKPKKKPEPKTNSTKATDEEKSVNKTIERPQEENVEKESEKEEIKLGEEDITQDPDESELEPPPTEEASTTTPTIPPTTETSTEETETLKNQEL